MWLGIPGLRVRVVNNGSICGRMKRCQKRIFFIGNDIIKIGIIDVQIVTRLVWKKIIMHKTTVTIHNGLKSMLLAKLVMEQGVSMFV